MMASMKTDKYFVLGCFVFTLIACGASYYCREIWKVNNIFISMFSQMDYWPLILLLVFFFVLYFFDFKLPERLFQVIDKTWLVALLVGTALAVCHFTIYEARPYMIDEYCFDFQGQIFAEGKMVGHWPYELRYHLLPDYYHHHFFVMFPNGDVFARYWPGHALLRAPFELVGVPWLLNILLAMGCLFLVKYLCWELFPKHPRAGLWGVLFLLASPGFLANALSLYPNTFYVFSSLGFVALLLVPTTKRIVFAGLLGSIAIVQHQPMPHALFALPWFVWLFKQEQGFKKVIVLCLGYLPIGLLVGVGWVWWMFSMGTPDKMGKPAGDMLAMISSLPSAIPLWSQPIVRTIALFKIWSWAIPGLGLLAVMGFWKSPKASALRYLGYSCITMYLGYYFSPYDSGHGWGYRYFEGAWGALIILAVAALYHVQHFQNDTVNGLHRKVGTAAIFGLLVMVPFRMIQIEQRVEEEIVHLPPFENNQIREIGFVDHLSRDQYRRYDLVHNDPFLRTPKILFWGHGQNYDSNIMKKMFFNFEPNEKDHRVYFITKDKIQNTEKLSKGERLLLEQGWLQ